MFTIVILIVVGFLILVAGIIGTFIMITYNNLIKSKNKVKNSWANIDVQLQRRFDLIPNLVETVKGFIIHEEKVLSNITAIKQQFTNTKAMSEKIEMNRNLSSSLNELNLIVEEYPRLKTDTNFLKLQNALAEIEEDISYARQFYNDAVTIYNNQLMTFPNSIIAKTCNLQKEALFDAVVGAEIAPVVKFRPRQQTCSVCGATLNENDKHCRYCGALVD